MENKNFNEVITLILKEDSRYDKAAYYFVRKALDFTVRKAKEEKSNKGTHVSGQQLLDGIRTYANEQYGPMASYILNEWRLTCCEDFGNIVFNLVDYGILGKTENDRKEDFSAIYEFHEAFEKPYMPKSKWIGPSVRIPMDDPDYISQNN